MITSLRLSKRAGRPEMAPTSGFNPAMLEGPGTRGPHNGVAIGFDQDICR